MKKIRWGILSTGRIAHQFAQDFPYVEQGELVGVASRSMDTAKAFAATYQIPRAYGSYQDLLDDPEIDAVYIGTPHTFHFQNTVDAFTRGKAVLCEKPLTTNPADCRALMKHAEESGCYLMEAMWTYFLPAVRQAKEWVEGGRIGTIKHVKADFGYPKTYDPMSREYNVDLAGGALLDMGIYPIALAWYFLGSDPERLDVISHLAPNGADDDVVWQFEYAHAVASLSTSFQCKLPNVAYIIGDAGYIALPDFWRASACHLYKSEECIDRFEDGRESIGLNFETTAVNQDLLAGKTQSDIMPWSTSLKFQEHMELVRSRF